MSEAGAIRPSRETLGERMTKHGHKKGRVYSPTYSCWSNMVARCSHPGATDYEKYGGAGITVCDRWRSFENFLADMGERPSLDHSLDRWPDAAGHYAHGNVRWATRRQQNRNRKSNRAVIRSDGVRFATIADAAEQSGGKRKSVADVLRGRQKSYLGFGWEYA